MRIVPLGMLLYNSVLKKKAKRDSLVHLPHKNGEDGVCSETQFTRTLLHIGLLDPHSREK